MAYETGTASGVNNLLDKLATFIGLNMPSWTIDKNATATTFGQSGGWWLTIHKGSVYQTLLGYHNGTIHRVINYLHTGYSGAGTSELQSGRPQSDSNNLYNYSAIFASDAVNSYKFFSDGVNYCHCVVEVSTNMYVHFGFGQAQDQITSNTVKDYCYSIYWSEHSSIKHDPTHYYNAKLGQGTQENSPYDSGIQMAYNNGSVTKFSCGSYNFGTPGSTAIRGLNSYLFTVFAYKTLLYSDGHFANHNSFVPMTVHAMPNLSNPQAIATLPDIAACKLTFYDIAQEVTVGSDTWVVFPWRSKDTTQYSQMFGYAYKKIP